MWSNVTNLQTSNILVWSNVAALASNVTNLQTSNTLVWSSLTSTALNFGTSAGGSTTFGISTQPHVINGSVLNVGSVLAPTISSITAITSGGNARVLGFPQVAVFALTSETGAVAVSTTPATWFRIPYPWKILGCRASVYTSSSSGAISIDVRSVASGTAIPTSNGGGTSIFSTLVTIDASRTSSIGSTTTSVLTTAAGTTGLADDTGLAVFVTGAGTGAAGLKLIIYYCIN